MGYLKALVVIPTEHKSKGVAKQLTLRQYDPLEQWMLGEGNIKYNFRRQCKKACAMEVPLYSLHLSTRCTCAMLQRNLPSVPTVWVDPSVKQTLRKWMEVAWWDDELAQINSRAVLATSVTHGSYRIRNWKPQNCATNTCKQTWKNVCMRANKNIQMCVYCPKALQVCSSPTISCYCFQRFALDWPGGNWHLDRSSPSVQTGRT